MGLAHQGFQHALVRSQELIDGGLLKAITLVFTDHRNPPGGLFGFETKVEQRGSRDQRHNVGFDISPAEQPRGKILQQQRHIVERVPIQFAFGVNGLDHLFEGAILVGLGLQHGGPGAGQHFPAIRDSVETGANGQEVHKTTDEVFEFAPVATGHHRPEDHIRLSGPLVQGDSQSGHEHHERSDTLVLGQGGRCFAHVLGNLQNASRGPAIFLNHRDRIRRQGQSRRGPRQLGFPVIQFLPQHGAPHRLPLPVSEVGVLDRQFGQRGWGLAAGEGLVPGAEFFKQHTE